MSNCAISDPSVTFTNYCHAEVDIIFWDEEGNPELFTTLAEDEQSGSSKTFVREIGEVFSVQFVDPCVPLEDEIDHCASRSPYFFNADYDHSTVYHYRG